MGRCRVKPLDPTFAKKHRASLLRPIIAPLIGCGQGDSRAIPCGRFVRVCSEPTAPRRFLHMRFPIKIPRGDSSRPHPAVHGARHHGPHGCGQGAHQHSVRWPGLDSTCAPQALHPFHTLTFRFSLLHSYLRKPLPNSVHPLTGVPITMSVF